MRGIEKFIKISKKISVSRIPDTERAYSLGVELVEEYKNRGYIKKLPLDLLQTDCYAFVPLTEYLLEKNKGIAASPVENNFDSSWMLKTDFCFMNVRGIGTEMNKTGTFIDAIKLLPSLRVSGIHLAPFFECALGIIYAVDSFNTVNSDCIDKTFLEYGMTGEEQVKFFIDFCHLLGMSVGFDLEPHVSQFSRVVLENPKFFRWLKFTSDKKLIFNEEDILKPENQNKICEEVKKIVNDALRENNLKSLDVKGREDETKKTHLQITRKLIDDGFWTVPSHTWKGAGIPQYNKYNKKDNYPEFRYLSWDGEDHLEHSFGVLTPFKFYDNVPINKIPDKNNKPILNKNTLNYFINIFPALQKKFNFDFVRFDFVDHIFDSIVDNNISYSDKLTPYIIKRTIKRARRGDKKYIGAMAERMGTDLSNYKKVGFDLILGEDVLNRIDSDFIKKTIRVNKIIDRVNNNKKTKISALFAVDTHDTGHSGFNCVPMSLYGIYGVALRHFVSRFCHDKYSPRPKYEVIGAQDGSIGLYEANNKEISIEWKNDLEMFRIYHNIESVYQNYKKKIDRGIITKIKNYKKYVSVWIIEGDGYKIICGINTSLKDTFQNLELKDIFPQEKNQFINPYTLEIKKTDEIKIGYLKPLNSFIFELTDS